MDNRFLIQLGGNDNMPKSGQGAASADKKTSYKPRRATAPNYQWTAQISKLFEQTVLRWKRDNADKKNIHWKDIVEEMAKTVEPSELPGTLVMQHYYQNVLHCKPIQETCLENGYDQEQIALLACHLIKHKVQCTDIASLFSQIIFADQNVKIAPVAIRRMKSTRREQQALSENQEKFILWAQHCILKVNGFTHPRQLKPLFDELVKRTGKTEAASSKRRAQSAKGSGEAASASVKPVGKKRVATDDIVGGDRARVRVQAKLKRRPSVEAVENYLNDLEQKQLADRLAMIANAAVLKGVSLAGENSALTVSLRSEGYVTHSSSSLIGPAAGSVFDPVPAGGFLNFRSTQVSSMLSGSRAQLAGIVSPHPFQPLSSAGAETLSAPAFEPLSFAGISTHNTPPFQPLSSRSISSHSTPFLAGPAVGIMAHSTPETASFNLIPSPDAALLRGTTRAATSTDALTAPQAAPAVDSVRLASNPSGLLSARPIAAPVRVPVLDPRSTEPKEGQTSRTMIP